MDRDEPYRTWEPASVIPSGFVGTSNKKKQIKAIVSFQDLDLQKDSNCSTIFFLVLINNRLSSVIAVLFPIDMNPHTPKKKRASTNIHYIWSRIIHTYLGMASHVGGIGICSISNRIEDQSRFYITHHVERWMLVTTKCIG